MNNVGTTHPIKANPVPVWDEKLIALAREVAADIKRVRETYARANEITVTEE